MAIPLKYNIRNLAVRKITTSLTAFGIGLVVAVLLAVLSLAEGLTSVFKTSGSDNNIIVLRKNSQSEIQSGIYKNQVPLIYTLPGIQKDKNQISLASAEAVVVINMEKKGGGTSNVTIRGVSEKGPILRPQFRLVEGRMFNTGLPEMIASQAISNRFKNMRLGDVVQVGSNKWRIVGIFDAGGTAADSEIWTDVERVLGDFKRSHYSSVLVKIADDSSRTALISSIEGDSRLALEGTIESKYYDEQTKVADPIKFLGIFIATIMAVGASFGAMNTMYANISTRVKEIATLRVLGFSRFAIMTSFVIESLIISLFGGIIGCVMGYMIVKLAIKDVTGTTNFNTFSEVVFAFQLTPDLVLLGLLLSLLVGLLGGLIPAAQAAYTKITIALRQNE
ncbi:MAG: ABC transporter permease [Thermodesulfobacteriota bacterium]